MSTSNNPTSEEAHLEGARAESVAAYRGLLADRDTRLLTARKVSGPDSDRWKRVDDKLRTSKEKGRAIFAKLQRLGDGKYISFWVFVIGAFALAAFEAPINKFMLDNILRGSNFDSYALSLFVTLALLILAHMAGHQARQIRGSYQEKVYASNITITVLILAVLAACVVALTIGRSFYSTTMIGPTGQDIFAGIRDQIFKVGIWTAFIEALSDKSAFFLACVNTAAIAVAFLAAFITHDSDKVYQSALDAERSADSTLSRMERRYQKKVEKIAQKFTPRLNNIAAAHGAQNARVVALKRYRNAPLTDEDNFDITNLDQFLAQARTEIGHRSRTLQPQISPNIAPNIAPTSPEEATTVSQLLRERR